MIRFWLAITGVLLFAAGGAVGVAGSRWMGSSPRVPDMSMFVPFRDGLADRDDLIERLDLTEEQKRELDELRKANRERLESLGVIFHETARDLEKGILAVLTEEQEERFKILKAERERQRIEERMRRELGRMSADIGIPADLQAKIYPLQVQAEIDKANLWKSCKGDKKEIREELTKISKDRDDEISKILPANLFEEYKKWKDRDRRRGGRDRGNGKPDGDGKHGDGKRGPRDAAVPPPGPPPGLPPGTDAGKASP